MPTIRTAAGKCLHLPSENWFRMQKLQKRKGTKVYHLNIGQPDIETPPQCLDAVRHSDFKVLEYSHSAGNESYRKKLVQYYKTVGIDVTHEQIIITTGEAIIFEWFYGLYGCR